MIYQIYPKQDSTIYEKRPAANTGLDALLELTKTLIVTGSASDAESYSSRILMKFDYADLDPIIEAGFDTGSANNKYKLKLYAVEEKQLPSSFSIEVNTISGSWNMGLGRWDYYPQLTNGVSWKYRYSYTNGTMWVTESFAGGSTGSWNLAVGGGNWYTDPTLTTTKVYNYNELKDPEIDITSLVNAHLTNVVTNDGFLIRRPTSEEIDISDSMDLKFFSSDTNTIYLPHLKVCWNDWSWNTGSLNPLVSTYQYENVIAFKNLRNTYYTDERIRFRLAGRPKYPIKTFSTRSAYSYEYYLPPSSSYAIEDLHTKETVIPHDDIYTRISCDPVSNYFNLWMEGLQPERWYKFVIKSEYDYGDIRKYDNSYIFKVERRS